ncbi:uncharacterized protein [Argopecten irradians]|uniref:uncharacterized protein n=1 Tax=Argopecten irradians TaxID=31199 RepID=UPI003723CB83
MEYNECTLQVGADKFKVSTEIVLKIFGAKIDLFLDVTSGTDRKYVIRRPKDTTMALIEYCYTGELHIPQSVCKGTFLTELKFWGLNHKLLESCCYHKLCSFVNDQKMLEGFERMHQRPENNIAEKDNSVKRRIWAIVNCDGKSKYSKAYFYVSTTFVLLMIGILALSSMKDAQDIGEPAAETMVEGNGHNATSASPTNDSLAFNDQPETESRPMVTNSPNVTTGIRDPPVVYPSFLLDADCGTCRTCNATTPGNDLNDEFKVEHTNVLLQFSECASFMLIQESEPRPAPGVEDSSQNYFYPPLIIHIRCDPCRSCNATIPTPKIKIKLKVEHTDIIMNVSKCASVVTIQRTPIKIELAGAEKQDSEDVTTLDPDHTEYNNSSYLNQTYRSNEMESSTRSLNVKPIIHGIGNFTAIDIPERSNLSVGNFTSKITFLEHFHTPVINSQEKLLIVSSSQNVSNISLIESVVCYYLEHVINSFFTMEFVLRLITCPDKKEFFRGILNWLDLLLLLGSFGRVLLELRSELRKVMAFLYDFLLYLQMFRVFRLFRTIENIRAFKVLRYSLVTGIKDIFVLVMYVMVTMCIFSNFIYFVENKSDFPSIPAAWWWSIVTMTTVGYGDMVPKTALGKLIGCICALSGVVLFSLIIPVFVTTFLTAYEYANGSPADEPREGDNNTIVSVSLNDTKPLTHGCHEKETGCLYNIEVQCEGHSENINNSGGNPKRKYEETTLETTAI